MKILLLDNYDSFTYNLVHLIRSLGHQVDVVRNDKITLEGVKAYDKILLSPGPGVPDEAGIMKSVVKEYGPTKSILGVCLGHQGIAEVYGAKLFNMPQVRHGVTCSLQVSDSGEALYRGVPGTFQVAQYHSWAVETDSLPDDLKVTAVNEAGLIMSIAHRQFDVRGVQYHPESIMTANGKRNYVELVIPIGMKQILNELIEHRSLDKETARQVLMDLAAGKYNPSQMSAFMTVYMMRAITLAELQGFRDAMLELCLPVKVDRPVMDVCGTGGDGKNTFNISTLSSFVVAAAGQPVAKHGNYGVSSVSGSSNVLEYFGYKFTNNKEVLDRSLDEANIFFMHAPLFHPAMKNMAPIRKELGVKTFFNMLGPMVNPAFPPLQLVGVFNLELARLYGYLYQQTDKKFIVLHDVQGYDEVSLTGPVKVFADTGERLYTPADLQMPEISSQDILGGSTVEESARLFLSILEGHGTTAQQQVVVANAALALFCADRKSGWSAAVNKATESLRSGRALGTFKKLIAISQES